MTQVEFHLRELEDPDMIMEDLRDHTHFCEQFLEAEVLQQQIDKYAQACSEEVRLTLQSAEGRTQYVQAAEALMEIYKFQSYYATHLHVFLLLLEKMACARRRSDTADSFLRETIAELSRPDTYEGVEAEWHRLVSSHDVQFPEPVHRIICFAKEIIQDLLEQLEEQHAGAQCEEE